MSAGIITVAATLLGLAYMACAGLYFGRTDVAKRNRSRGFHFGFRMQPQRARIDRRR